jgi:hypothetical protein
LTISNHTIRNICIGVAVALVIAAIVWYVITPAGTVAYGAITHIPGADVVMFQGSLDSSVIQNGIDLFLQSR